MVATTQGLVTVFGGSGFVGAQAVRVLEQAFGTTLVERGRRGQRGVCLTEAGRAALLRLRIAHHEMRAALDAATGPGLVTLRIGTLPLAMIALRFEETVPPAQRLAPDPVRPAERDPGHRPGSGTRVRPAAIGP